MTTFLWILIAIQVVMGVFDTFYHHELTERLAWRPSQRYELKLHGMRNLLYAFLFLVLGCLEVYGVLAVIVILVLVIEIIITLMDFVEEDLSRKLPPSERINHTLLAINYGAILVLLLPVLIEWALQPTGVAVAYTGFPASSLPRLRLALLSAACAILRRQRGLAASTAAGRRTRCKTFGAEDNPGHWRDRFIGSRLVAALGEGATGSSRWFVILRRPRCSRLRSR